MHMDGLCCNICGYTLMSYIDNLVQDCSNSIANALELPQPLLSHRYLLMFFMVASHALR